MLQGKRMSLILTLNFLVLIVLHYLIFYHQNNQIQFRRKYKSEKPNLVFSAWCLFPFSILSPLMGCLADSYFGRFRVLKFGVWLMWAASFLSCLLAIAKFRARELISVLSWLDVVLYSLLSFGMSLFQATIFQFGVDQLTDSSSVEIKSYINWHTWTFFFSEVVIFFSQGCFSKWRFHFAMTLVLPVSLTVALLLLAFFDRNLVVEPITHNPLRLIFRVLRYAVKTKQPRQRSAFTFWENKPYSRIDLAKSKYGGPFTIEEVENVKVFLRILAVITVMCAFIGLGYAYVDLLPRTVNMDSSKKNSNSSTSLCVETSVVHLGSILVVLVVPAYELVISPLCPKCLTVEMTSRKKFSAGIVCWVINMGIYLILVGTRRHQRQGHHCLLFTGEMGFINYYLVPIPKIFECFSKIWLFGAVQEFLCAQAPYSMKGFLFGTTYALSAIFIALGFVVFLPFHYRLSRVRWEGVKMGCEFWFFVVFLGLSLVLAVCFAGVNCTYRNRKRSEDLPSEHYFAENYYDHSDPVIAEPMQDASS